MLERVKGIEPSSLKSLQHSIYQVFAEHLPAVRQARLCTQILLRKLGTISNFAIQFPAVNGVALLGTEPVETKR